MMELPPAVRTPAVTLLEVGQRAPEFRDLLGVDGRRHALLSFDATQLLVIIFSCNGCPTVKASPGILART